MSIYKVKLKKHELRCYGTCFLIKNNYLLTACHILIEGCEIYIYYRNSWVKCSLVKQDKRLDTALLKPVLQIEDKPYNFKFMISNSNVYSEHYSEESLIKEHSDGKILRKNTVSPINIDSTIVNFGINHGCSGCPLLCSISNEIVGMLTWTKNGKSGGCVLRLIQQFVKGLESAYSIRYGLDVFCKYNEKSASILHSNVEYLISGQEIKRINGNPVGDKLVSIESMVYFSENDYCYVETSEGESILVQLKMYEKCQFCFDKPLSNVTFLDDIIC